MSALLLPSRLLLGSLLLSFAATAQQAGPPPAEAAPLLAAAEAAGPIPIEPDSALRRQYARHRVRSVTKVRLDDEGTVQDTVEYHELDALGRRTLRVHYSKSQPNRQQWTYNAAGYCTSLVTHQAPGRPFTTIYHYNPKRGQGIREVLQPDGTRTPVCVLERRQHGDTLITTGSFHQLIIGTYHFQPDSRFRQRRYAPHPDTVLTIIDNYSPTGRRLRTQAEYELFSHGRPVESGQLNLTKGTRRRAGASVWAQLTYRLRHEPESLMPTTHFRYDAQQRLVEHEINTVSLDLRLPAQSVKLQNTYNALNQLIAQQRSSIKLRYSQAVGVPESGYYTVFAYSPEGLVAGETTNRGSLQPMFYRYLYQFYQ